jgi:outer membrane protein assembly factor BamB
LAGSKNNSIYINILIGFGLVAISIISCGRPAPIMLSNTEYLCSWNQGGGSPARIAYVPAKADIIPNLIWSRRLKTPLLVEPTAGSGFIFIPTTNDRIAIVSYDDGNKFGELHFKGPVSDPCGLVDSLIVVNEDGHQMVVENWVSGRRVWQVELKGSEIEPLIHNKRIYWQDETGSLQCYEVLEGKRIWEKKLEFKLVSPAAATDSALILAGDGPNIECLSSIDGNRLWQVDMGNRIRNPIEIVGETVLYCTVDGHIGAFSLKDGSRIWDIDNGPGLIAPPATDGEGIYFGTNNGHLVKYSFNSGQKIWDKDVGSPIKAGATIFGDMVIFVSLNHKAYFVDKNDGTVKSEFVARGMLSVRPIACSNRIYIAGEDKNLYCFQVAKE